ncbi:MAG: ABC transporter permease [Ruminococcus sp.]|nr:ABC transporter permease [Ruminococcus sp.]
MINMFKAELYRLVRSRGFWFFWVLSLGTLILAVIYHQTGGITLGAPLDYDESTKLDIRQIAMNFSFYFFLIFLAFTIIAGEFSEHTVKNSITSAVSKRGFFLSKFFFTLVFSLLSMIAVNYLFYFLNRAVNGSKYSSSVSEFSKAFLGQLPLFAATVSVFILAAFVLKRAAAFNAVVIITPIAYTTIVLAVYSIESTRKVGEKLLTYELSTMIGKLAIGCTDSYRAKCYILSAAVTVFSFVLGYLLWNKREIDG